MKKGKKWSNALKKLYREWEGRGFSKLQNIQVNTIQGNHKLEKREKELSIRLFQGEQTEVEFRLHLGVVLVVLIFLTLVFNYLSRFKPKKLAHRERQGSKETKSSLLDA